MNDKKQIGYCRGKPYEKADHLAYLRIEESLFETAEEKALKERSLCCVACGHPVTNVAEKVDVFGRHEWAFHLYNEIVQLGCYRNAEGCAPVRQISHGYTWFRGYAWQIMVCENCHIQLGWKYTSPEDSFYGLMLTALQDEDPEKPADGADLKEE